MKFIGYDLFAGAGGVTTGIEQARFCRKKIAEVIACINHDPVAIESHAANHKHTVHFIEDIKDFDVKRFPAIDKNDDVRTFLWASLECTNFSNAKGGLPRDADSRTLANHLFRYIEHLMPDYILIENVKEFMSWGDLDENCKPVSRDKGRLYQRWINRVKSYGYEYSFRILNSADYGAYTSRKRLFIIFNKAGLPVEWPEPTHAKKPDMYGLKKWKAVKDVLDLDDKGKSIFRDKPLSEKTYERIYTGCIKYIAGGDESFITKWLGNDQQTGINQGKSINEPCPVVTTQNRLGLVSPEFLIKYHGNGHNILSVDDCGSTLSTKDRLALVQSEFLLNYNHSSKANGISEPAPTLLAADKLGIISTSFIDEQYGQSRGASIDEPAGALVSNPKQCLVSAENFFLMNPQFNNKGGSIEDPCFTLIAKMDKRPPYLVVTESGQPAIEVYESDSPAIVKIKKFMAAYGIIDIKMRMLKINELLRIQGFGDRYILKGTQADQKKFIGNAVVPVVAKKMFEALYKANVKEYKIKKSA